MADKVSRQWCTGCNDWARATKIGPSHILHLLLSILTLGAWLIVWMWVSFLRPFTCDACGVKTRKRMPRSARAERAAESSTGEPNA